MHPSGASSLLSALQNHHLDLPAAQQEARRITGKRCCPQVSITQKKSHFIWTVWRNMSTVYIQQANYDLIGLIFSQAWETGSVALGAMCLDLCFAFLFLPWSVFLLKDLLLSKFQPKPPLHGSPLGCLLMKFHVRFQTRNSAGGGGGLVPPAGRKDHFKHLNKQQLWKEAYF